MTSTRTEDGLHLEVLIEAPPEAVFPHLVEPDRIIGWMGAAITGDISVGGGYRLDIFGDGRAVAIGQFIDIDPPRRVVMTWGWDGDDGVPPGSTTVTIELTSVDAGTMVVLTHTGLPDGALASHGEGWAHYLGRLVIAGAGGDPGPDHTGAGTG